MTDLAARLQKVIEERLAVAHAATQGSWTWERRADEGWGDQGPWLKTSTPTDESPFVLLAWGHDASGLEVTEEDMAHIALNDPSDAILECEFALALLDEMAHWRHVLTGDYLHTCSVATEERGGKCDCGVAARRTRLLALLAKRHRLVSQSQDQSHNAGERGQSPDTVAGT